MFRWQICHNVLSTHANLPKWKLHLHPICLLCYSKLESTSNLFTQCFIVKKTWELVFQHKQLVSNIPSLGIMSILNPLNYVKTQATNNQMDRIIFLVWSMWKSRNTAVFKNQIYNSMAIILHAKKNWVRLESSKKVWYGYNIINQPSSTFTTTNHFLH